MAWELTGNAGTTAANFLGTTDAVPLVIKSNNLPAIQIDPNGNVGVGTDTIYHTLQVGGGYDGNLGFDASDGTPNAGYLRFGDNTGWQFHITRQREQGGGAPLNTGTTGVLMTIQGNGNVQITGNLSASGVDIVGSINSLERQIIALSEQISFLQAQVQALPR
jgi:hypothetical protein